MNDECHLYESSTLSTDSCRNINGTYVSVNRTCYYRQYSCPYHSVAGQCYRNATCAAFSCDTCRLYDGHFEPATRW